MAWFPAETQVTPRASSSGERSSMTQSAPRGLKLPVRWKSSSLRMTSVLPSRRSTRGEESRRTGSFKPRGALCVMLDLSPEELARGVTCVSAGNHAMATAYAAAVLGTTAKVVMPKKANPFRVAGSRELGAEVVLVDVVPVSYTHLT